MKVLLFFSFDLYAPKGWANVTSGTMVLADTADEMFKAFEIEIGRRKNCVLLSYLPENGQPFC